MDLYSTSQKMKHVGSRGFTLVELMVSLTIFSITILISVSTLLVMIDVNAKAQALYSATTNLSFALDSLTREFRTGYNYYCSDVVNQNDEGFRTADMYDDGTDCQLIAFTRQRDNYRMGYRLNPACRETGREDWSCIEQRIENPNGTIDDIGWTPITSGDVTIETFSVDIENADPYSDRDYLQPAGTLRVQGNVSNGLDTDTRFNIQTRIVQRVLDVR